MKRSMLVLVASLAILITLVVAFAATDAETPNDPRVNPNANACYTGGSMEGKCGLDDELWIAGWYAIRLQYNLIDGNQVPIQYKWILPPASEPNNEADVTDEPIGANPTSPFNTSTAIPTEIPTNPPTMTSIPTREFPTAPPKPPTATRMIPTPTFTPGPPPTVTALPQ